MQTNPLLGTTASWDAIHKVHACGSKGRSTPPCNGLFAYMNEGLAQCQMISSEADGPDFVFLAVNPAFEKLTGLRDVVGKRASEVMPGVRESDQRLLQICVNTAQTRVPAKLEIFHEMLQMWLSISIYSQEENCIMVLFDVITERKQAEKALRDSEESLRALFEDAPLPSHEIDCNGIVVRVNRAECELLGLEAWEMIGRPIWEFVCPAEQDASRAAVASKLVGPQVAITAERTFRSRSGTDLVLEFHDRLKLDSAGKAIGIRTTLVDVTEAKNLNARLAVKNQLLRALLDQSPDRIYFKDREGRFTLGNAAVAKQMNLDDPSQLIGKTDFDFFSAEHAEAAYQDEQDLVHERVPVISTEEKETFPDGRETWASTSKLPFRDPSGKITGTFGISRDITERGRLEQTIRISEDRLLLAERFLNLGTWEFNIVTDRVQCSPKLMQLYGRSGEPANAADWLCGVHPDDQPGVTEALEKSLRTGEPLSRRFRVVWPDGSVHWLHSTSHVIRDCDNRPLRVIGMDFDVTEAARAEEQLRILSTAVEQSPVSIVITNLKGDIEYVNSKTTELTGYSAEELIGQNPRVLKSGTTSPDEYRKLWNTIQTGEWRGTFQNRKKSGEVFWEAALIRPIRDRSGVPTHYLAVKEDITAQRATEEALRISEERFRIAAESAGDVVFEWDVETGRFLFLAASLADRYPMIRPPDDTKEWLALMHPDDRSHMWTAAARHFSTREPLQEEYRVLQSDGNVLELAVRAVITGGTTQRKSKSIGVVTDITARKAAERANAELAAIVESADTAILSRDLSGKILTWNAGAERIYGYRAEEMIGRNVAILFPPDRAGEQQEITDTLRRGERVKHLETVRLTNTGEPKPVLVSASPVRNRAGEVVGGAHVVWDITQLKLLQQQLAQAQKLESIGQLAAGIAHEINTPVQYIGDNAQFLSSAFQDLFQVIESPSRSEEQDTDVAYLREEIPKAIQQMQEGVDRVAGIVRAMKRFSHPGPVDKIPTDIVQAIESTILISRNEWKYVAELTTDFDPDLPAVPCIAGEFNQVILNLIVNAAHAIADKNHLGEKGEIRVETRRNGAFAEIRVSDTGSGIPEAIRCKVFDPFFTTKAVGKGTGQGLAIAHSVIVQKHGGRIDFESETGKGTTFLIQLPLHKSADIQ